MFQNLQNKIIRLNEDAQATGNFQKSKDLKKKLSRTGGVMTLFGYAGFLTCAVFLLLDFFQGLAGGFSFRFWISLALVLPFGLLCFFGNSLSMLSTKIPTAPQKNDNDAEKS